LRGIRDKVASDRFLYFLFSFPALVCSSHSQTTTARLQVSVETLLCTEKFFAAIADLASNSFFWNLKEEICGHDIIKVPDVIQQDRIGDRSVQLIHGTSRLPRGPTSRLPRGPVFDLESYFSAVRLVPTDKGRVLLLIVI